MSRRPFSDLTEKLIEDPKRQARLDVMKRAMEDSYELTLTLRNEGFTEQQIIDKLREAEAEISSEDDLYRTTFRDYIDAMRRDLADRRSTSTHPPNRSSNQITCAERKLAIALPPARDFCRDRRPGGRVFPGVGVPARFAAGPRIRSPGQRLCRWPGPWRRPAASPGPRPGRHAALKPIVSAFPNNHSTTPLSPIKPSRGDWSPRPPQTFPATAQEVPLQPTAPDKTERCSASVEANLF